MLSNILCFPKLLSSVSAYLYIEELPIVLSLDRHNAIFSRGVRRRISLRYFQIQEWLAYHEQLERWRGEQLERWHANLPARMLQSAPGEIDDSDSS
jgi:hypothetical protein